MDAEFLRQRLWAWKMEVLVAKGNVIATRCYKLVRRMLATGSVEGGFQALSWRGISFMNGLVTDASRDVVVELLSARLLLYLLLLPKKQSRVACVLTWLKVV